MINIATLSPVTRHHLIEIKGFITSEHSGMQALLVSLGSSVLNISFLGAYAVPVALNIKNNPQETRPHASVKTTA